MALVRGLPWDSAFARANGAPLDPSSGLVEVLATLFGGATSTAGRPAAPAAPTATIADLAAMASDARGGDR